MFKMFGGNKKHTKDSVRRLVVDIKHPIKIKSADVEASINKSDFLEAVINKTGVVADGAKTIFSLFISNRFAMIVVALALALGGFFIAAAQTRQLDNFITEDASMKANTDSNSQSFYAQILRLFSSMNEAPALISSFREFNKVTVAATEATKALRAEWFSLIWSDGEGLIVKLEKARSETKATADLLTNIKDGIASLGTITDNSEDLLALQSKAQKEAEFFSKMMNLVRGESAIAIFFVNNLEIEVADKLIKSYAIIRIADGEIKDILVNDIPYPDQFADTKIIAQIPFVNININEEAKNISQFFNFSASAPKMLGFLEALPIYANQKIKFDGAIAVNYGALADILKITGPIKLPEHDIIFNQNNFITEIQKELFRESAIRNAKRNNILTSLISEMVLKIQKMSGREIEELAGLINHRLDNRDIQFYFIE